MESTSGGRKQLFAFEPESGRLELLVRIVYWFLIGIVLWVYGFLGFICLVIQWFHILFLGRRSEGLSHFIQGYAEYYVHVMNYTMLFTDERPRILPEPVRIFEEKAE